MFLKIGSSGLISGLGSRKWIFCENGFLNISTSRSSSCLVKSAVPLIFSASASVKQSPRAMLRAHFVLAASRNSWSSSTISITLDWISFSSLSLALSKPCFRQRMYSASVRAMREVYGMIVSSSMVAVMVFESGVPESSSISTLASSETGPLRVSVFEGLVSLPVNTSAPLEFFGQLPARGPGWRACFAKQVHVTTGLADQVPEHVVVVYFFSPGSLQLSCHFEELSFEIIGNGDRGGCQLYS